MAPKRHEFAICVRNKGYEVSLERRKVYEVLPDADAAKHHQLRVVDESGDDHLYPDRLASNTPTSAARSGLILGLTPPDSIVIVL
jgi:hypothetical protein